MEITQASLDIIFRAANLQFQQALLSTPSWADQIATTIPMATRQVTFGWMDRLPILREWVGNRVVNAATTHARNVTVKPFELTLALDKFDVRDDQMGIFSFGVQSMGEQARKWPDQQLARWLRSDASTVNSYDGVPQFSTVHPTNGGDVSGPSQAGGFGGNQSVPATQSNLAVSTALSADNYAAARAAMQAFVGADGQPLGVIPDLLVVPPALEQIGRLILEASFISNINSNSTAPQENIWKNSARLLVIPELATKSTNWWLFDTKKVVKPLIWNLRDAPVFTARTSPADPAVFDAHQFMYGIEARGVPSESLWFLSYAATSAAAY
jgi:phage major head subunit gpT-like protein